MSIIGAETIVGSLPKISSGLGFQDKSSTIHLEFGFVEPMEGTIDRIVFGDHVHSPLVEFTISQLLGISIIAVKDSL